MGSALILIVALSCFAVFVIPSAILLIQYIITTIYTTDIFIYIFIAVAIVVTVAYALTSKKTHQFLADNHDPIESIAQIVAVVAGVSTAAYFMVSQRGGRYERAERTVDLYMTSAKKFQEINEVWERNGGVLYNVVAEINYLSAPRKSNENGYPAEKNPLEYDFKRLATIYSTTENIEKSDMPLPKMNREFNHEIYIDSLERAEIQGDIVKLDACIQDKFCDKDVAVDKFCYPIYQWDTITRLEGLTYGKIIELILSARKFPDAHRELMVKLDALKSRKPQDATTDTSINRIVAYCDRNKNEYRIYEEKLYGTFFVKKSDKN